MVQWHHRLNEREFEQAPGDGGQGSLVGCSPWGSKESDMTERPNNYKNKYIECNRGKPELRNQKTISVKRNNLSFL